MKRWSFVLLLCWAPAVPASDAPPLDRTQALLSGGNLQVFADQASRPYVTLSKTIYLRVQRGEWRQKTHEVIAITNDAGRSRASMQFTFHESVKFTVQGATITPNNMRLDLGKNGVQTKTVGHFIQYTVLFPSVAEGSILDLEYETRGKWTLTYDEYLLADSEPILHAEVMIADPDEIGVVVALRNGHEGQQITRHENEDRGTGTKTTGYEFSNLRATGEEPASPPAGVYWPGVMMYAVNDENWNWAALREEPYFRAACNLTGNEEAKKLVASRTGNVQDPAQKCAALLQFVRNEVQILGGGGQVLYPQAAAATLTSRAGDAMDVAGLAVGLLRQAGLEVRLALVRRGTAGDWNGTVYKARQFDRFLPYVKLGESWHWLDPVCKECGFDDLDASYCGTTAILFQNDVGREIDAMIEDGRRTGWAQSLKFSIHNAHWTDIIQVCAPEPWLSAPDFDESFDLALGGDGSLRGDLEVAVTGQSKLALREDLIEADDAGRLAWLAGRLKDRIPGVQLDSLHCKGVEPDVGRGANADTLLIHARLTVPGSGGDGRIVLPARLFATAVRDPLHQGARKNPVWFGRATRSRTLVMLKLPEGFHSTGLPQPTHVRTPALEYHAAYAESGGVLQFQREVSRPRATFAPGEAPAVHAAYLNVEKAEARSIEIVADQGARR